MSETEPTSVPPDASPASPSIVPGPAASAPLVGSEGGASEAQASTPESRSWRETLAAVTLAVVVTRVLFFAVGYAAEWLFRTEPIKPVFSFDTWYRWDTFHYLAIAEHGYVPEIVDGHAPAFFPLFPLTVRWVSHLGLSYLVAGLLVSAIATFVASFYLFRLAELHGFDGAKSILYLLLFPTGVFLAAAYTEAIFLAGAIPAFYYAFRGRPWAAVPFAAIAVASRTVGLFVLLGVAVELIRWAWPSWRKLFDVALAMGLASLPFWLYGLYLKRTWGSFFAFQTAQKDGWGRDFVGFREGFWTTYKTWNTDTNANLIFTSRLELVFAALSLVLLGWLLWRRWFGYACYVGATLVIALGNAWYYSNPRLALAFFPFAFLIAALVGERERRHTYTVLVLSGLACLGVVAFTRSVWFF